MPRQLLRTALLAATEGNHEAVARLLIDAGSDVNAQDDKRDSPYLLAGASGHLGILRMTLAAGEQCQERQRHRAAEERDHGRRRAGELGERRRLGDRKRAECGAEPRMSRCERERCGAHR